MGAQGGNRSWANPATPTGRKRKARGLLRATQKKWRIERERGETNHKGHNEIQIVVLERD